MPHPNKAQRIRPVDSSPTPRWGRPPVDDKWFIIIMAWVHGQKPTMVVITTIITEIVRWEKHVRKRSKSWTRLGGIVYSERKGSKFNTINNNGDDDDNGRTTKEGCQTSIENPKKYENETTSAETGARQEKEIFTENQLLSFRRALDLVMDLCQNVNKENILSRIQCKIQNLHLVLTEEFQLPDLSCC